MNFLPDNYKSPIATNNYLKMQEGENRFRILTQPIMGWEDWQDNKPIRFAMNDKPTKSIDPEKPVKFFWAFVVYNVTENVIQIMQVTQNTIIKSIEAYCRDPDWGNPYNYDIKIKKSGKGKETQYVTSPVPHKPIDQSIIDMFKAKPCNLDALFTGSDPFSADSYTCTPLAIEKSEPVEIRKPRKNDKSVRRITDEQHAEIKAIADECDEEDARLQILDMARTRCYGSDATPLSKDEYEKVKMQALQINAQYRASKLDNIFLTA